MKKNSRLYIIGSLVITIVVAVILFFAVFVSTQAAPTVSHFWIGSTNANWSNPLNWSLSSGGAPCNCVPGMSHVAGFDQNGNTPVVIDGPVSVRDIVFTNGYSGTVSNPAGSNVSIAFDLHVESPAILGFGSGSWAIGDDVVMLDGTASINLQSATISVSGDWSNVGVSIVPGTSTVALDGPGLNQNIFGNNIFYNLVIDPEQSKFVGLQQNSTTIIENNFVASGMNPANKVHIQTVNSAGLPVQVNANIDPRGSVSVSYLTVQYNTNLGGQSPLVSLDDEVVEIVPFSTQGWFPARGPGGITSNIETWSLANAVPLNNNLNKAIQGDTVRQFNSIFGGTILSQTDITKQPTFIYNAFNFNPVLQFDGIDDVLYSPSGWTSDAYYIAVKPDTSIQSNLTTTPSFFAPISWLSQELCFPAGGFVLGGPFTGTIDGEVITHAVGGGGAQGNIYRTAEAYPGDSTIHYQNIPAIFSAVENQAGNFQEIFAHGALVSNDSYLSHIGFADDEFYLGSYVNPVLPNGVASDSCELTLEYVPDGFFAGQIGEIISFNQRHDSSERGRVESYLALKYGVPLDQSLPGGQDYLAHDGATLMWDASFPGASTFNHGISGIGQDNHSALYQPKSRSVEQGGVVTIGSPQDLENMEFLTWAHDDAPINLWAANPVNTPKRYARLQRTWQVQETGDVGPVTVFVNKNDVPATVGSLYLLTDMDNDLRDATPRRMVLVGDEWQLEQPYNFSSGERFALAYQQVIVEFEHATLSGPENNPVTMTNFLVQGELTGPVTLSLVDSTFSFFGGPQATAGIDYQFITPQTIIIPAGDYRVNVLAIPLQLTIVPDTIIEPNEHVLFSISGLRTEITGGDITGDGITQLTHLYIITNDDSVSIIVEPTLLQMAEGSSAPYTIALSHQPKVGTQVVVDIFFGEELENGQGTGVIVGQVVFDAFNWNIPQTVMVWAAEDEDIEGVHFDTVTHSVGQGTTDPGYGAIQNVQHVDVQIYDNDIAPESEGNGSGSTGSGCLDPKGCVNQTPDDGDGVEILGCMDISAVNTNYSATVENGSCLYLISLDEITDFPNTATSQEYLLDALTGIGECPYFAGFYKLGDEGPMIARWQAFLNVLLGTNLTVDGRFGPATDAAVRQYHDQWAEIILVPWGHTNPTGYIYKTTNATGNSMIGCPLGTLFISETGEYFNADTYNSSFNLQALTDELRSALNINLAQLLDGYSDPTQDYTQ